MLVSSAMWLLRAAGHFKVFMPELSLRLWYVCSESKMPVSALSWQMTISTSMFGEHIALLLRTSRLLRSRPLLAKQS